MRGGTHVDVSLAVAQEEVVHDGAVVQVLQCRHVLHARHAALVHLVDLLPGEGALLVGVHLRGNTHQHNSVTLVLSRPSLPPEVLIGPVTVETE